MCRLSLSLCLAWAGERVGGAVSTFRSSCRLHACTVTLWSSRGGFYFILFSLQISSPGKFCACACSSVREWHAGREKRSALHELNCSFIRFFLCRWLVLYLPLRPGVWGVMWTLRLGRHCQTPSVKQEFTDLPQNIVTLLQGAALSVTLIDQSLPARSALKGADKYSAGEAVKVFVCCYTTEALLEGKMLLPCYHWSYVIRMHWKPETS